MNTTTYSNALQHVDYELNTNIILIVFVRFFHTKIHKIIEFVIEVLVYWYSIICTIMHK